MHGLLHPPPPLLLLLQGGALQLQQSTHPEVRPRCRRPTISGEGASRSSSMRTAPYCCCPPRMMRTTTAAAALAEVRVAGVLAAAAGVSMESSSARPSRHRFCHHRACLCFRLHLPRPPPLRNNRALPISSR